MDEIWSCRTDQFGNRYLSAMELARLPHEHVCWEALFTTPYHWRNRLPIQPPRETHDDYASGMHTIMQFQAETNTLLGFVTVHVQEDEHDDAKLLVLVQQDFYIRRRQDCNFSAALQRTFLIQLMLQEVWAHEHWCGDVGIDLPDELYATDQVPDWDVLAWSHDRAVHNCLYWQEGKGRPTLKYEYRPMEQIFVNATDM